MIGGKITPDPTLKGMKYYGDTIIGERGQIVIPAELRKKFGIETGDRFLVMGGERMDAWGGFLLVKADILSRVVQEIFGGRLEEVLVRQDQTKSRQGRTTEEEGESK
ncbi:MAG TPA: AbrB/MazE/SpoVT family DNA-binding domain-containing protein [Candidatus Acidoferrales bacterium]|nr:AbrB/MazE/SpoVT family DNA-binding domain-containing protein [Candidatus Acidoferrales bacterium]